MACFQEKVKMERADIYKRVGTGVLLGVSSFYLTWLIDRVTLSTWLQRIFVFSYFIAISVLLLRVRRSRRGNLEGRRRSAVYVFSVAGAIFCVLLCRNTMLPQEESAQLRLTNVSQTAQSEGQEVWLISLKIDGNEVPLSGLSVLENDNWVYSADADDFYCTEPEENCLLLDLPPHGEAELGFITSPWSGSVAMQYGQSAAKTFSLYDASSETASVYQTSLSIGQATSGWLLVVLALGSLTIFAFFLSWVGEFYCAFSKKRAGMPAESAPIKRRKLCAVLIVSLLVVGSVFVQQAAQNPSLWLEQKTTSVTFVNEGPDPDGKASEVWLKISEGGQKIAPEKIAVPAEESGWTIRDGCFLSVTPGAELTLPFQIPSDIEFSFMSHAWTGKASIRWEGQTESYDFYSEGSSLETIRAPWSDTMELTYSWPRIALLVACGLFVWGLLFGVLLRYHENSWFILFGISWAAVTLAAVDIGRMNGIFMLLLGISLCMAVWLRSRPAMMEKYFHAPALVAVTVLSLYFTFALAGNQLFMTGTRMELTGNTISYFILLVVTVCPVLYGILALFEFAITKSKNLKPENNRKKIWSAGFIFFFLFAGIELICSLGFYPAVMSTDGVTHWCEAVGCWRLTDAHPIAFTLFIRLLSRIAFTPYVYTVFQILLCAFVISKWLSFLYEKGVSLKALVAFDIFMAILPSNYMLLVLMSKNPLFAILNLWVLLQIARLLDNPQKCVHGVKWNIESAIAIAALYVVRKNSFLGVYGIFIIIILITCFSFRFIRWKALPSLVGALAIILMIEGPMYDYFDPDKTGKVCLPRLTTVYSSLLVNNLEAPEDIRKTMENVLPVEEYYARYNPYNSDIMGWTDPRPNYSDMTTSRSLAIYLRLLALYPDVLIQERLQGTDLLWNIFWNGDGRAWNNRANTGIHSCMPQKLLPQFLKDTEPSIYNSYFKPNKISNVLCTLNEFTGSKPLIDMFIWRNGIYIVLSLAFMIVIALNHRMSCSLVFIPSLLALVTLLLVVGWQIYDYTYFFPMATVAFITCGCVINPGIERKELEKDG